MLAGSCTPSAEASRQVQLQLQQQHHHMHTNMHKGAHDQPVNPEDDNKVLQFQFEMSLADIVKPDTAFVRLLVFPGPPASPSGLPSCEILNVTIRHVVRNRGPETQSSSVLLEALNSRSENYLKARRKLRQLQSSVADTRALYVSVHGRLINSGRCPHGANNFGVAFSDKILRQDVRDTHEIITRLLANDCLVALEFVEKSIALLETKLSTAHLNGLGIIEDQSPIALLSTIAAAPAKGFIGGSEDSSSIVPLDLEALNAFVGVVRTCLEEIDRVSICHYLLR